MAEASIPVDLRNPGQVFACLGLMEAAESILDETCEGGFDYANAEFQTSFTLASSGEADPIATVVRFLARAEVVALAPSGSSLSTDKWNVPTEQRPNDDLVFPSPPPDSPAALPILLRAEGIELPVEHWSDGDHSGRDNVKFWAGMAGYPGAGLARDALSHLRDLGDNALAELASDPFGFLVQMSSSFNLDLRRTYTALNIGFSPDAHGRIKTVGSPLVEMLAAIGLQNARPARIDRRDKLAYRYGVSSVRLPVIFVRANLGAQDLGLPIRLFRMRLGWPGQEGQARCIIDAEEELSP